VVNRFPQEAHSRRRRMAAPSSEARESTTRESSSLQNGHRTVFTSLHFRHTSYRPSVISGELWGFLVDDLLMSNHKVWRKNHPVPTTSRGWNCRANEPLGATHDTPSTVATLSRSPSTGSHEAGAQPGRPQTGPTFAPQLRHSATHRETALSHLARTLPRRPLEPGAAHELTDELHG